MSLSFLNTRSEIETVTEIDASETAGTRDGRSGAAMGAATALRLPL